jgi:hypothetical protein
VAHDPPLIARERAAVLDPERSDAWIQSGHSADRWNWGWWCRLTKVGEDVAHGRRVNDEGDDAHFAAAAIARVLLHGLARLNRCGPGDYHKDSIEAPKSRNKLHGAARYRNSYASEDAVFASQLANELRQRGCSILMFSSSKPEGQDRLAGTDLDELPAQFDSARVFVPIISGAYTAKKWTLAELRHACSRAHERIIPVVAETAPPLDSLDVGLPPTIAYLDHAKLSLSEVASSIVRRLDVAQAKLKARRALGRLALVVGAFLVGVLLAVAATLTLVQRSSQTFRAFWEPWVLTLALW